MSTPHEFIVIGGGIAGLAIAELLQRSGARVALIEKDGRLCSGASAEQQGWFHTGALYAALPTSFYCRTLVGNLDDLVDYYAGFPNMNLKIEKHVSARSQDGWFANRTNFYAYESLSSVDWKWKLPWSIALHRARSRMSWFENLDTSRSLSRQIGMPSKPTGFVMHSAPLGANLGPIAFTLKSRDRVMDTRLIAQDLARAFLSSGGDLRTGTEVTGIDKGVVHARSKGHSVTFRGRHVIVTTGKASDRFDPSIRVLMSPLLVVTPALTDASFVLMSPHMKRTINHLCHRTAGVEYSVLGNAAYYRAAGNLDDVRGTAAEHMKTVARNLFGSLEGHLTAGYIGFKTEASSSSSLRNYLYHIVDRDAYTLALPGKFSLCFSLAVNVCRHFGIDPVERVQLDPFDVTSLVAEPVHYQLAKDLLARQTVITSIGRPATFRTPAATA